MAVGPLLRPARPSDVEEVRTFDAAHIPDHYRALIGEDAARAQVEQWWGRDRIRAAIERR